jgi:HD-GYP domain-containing protein (c-di-GMP phosphodiesterase class II)
MRQVNSWGKVMSKRRIAVDEIGIGTVLPWDAYDEYGRLLLRKGLVVSTSTQIEGLIERGLFIDIQKRERAAPVVHESTPSTVASILEARRRLQLVCAADGAKAGFPEQIVGINRLLAAACRLNQDAALATALWQREGRYSIRHSVDVAVACQVIGSALKMEERELQATVAAALTMNISILHLQDSLQLQREPLTPEQHTVIQNHPEASAAVLREFGVKDELWLQAVMSHHEAIDGSGYKQGRTGDQIPVPAQLLSLADIYCARISSRSYRPALRPNAALRKLFLDQGKKVRDGLASQFIKAIGVFPPGTPVRLENGEIAVVTERGETAAQPVVSSIIGPRGMPLAVPVKRDTGRPTYGVREVVDWNDVGAMPSMQALWGKHGALE